MIKWIHHAQALLLALCLGSTLSAQAAPSSVAADSQVGQAVEELNLEQLLTQIQLASAQVNYQGVFVSHWANQQLVTSAITNLYNNHHLLRRIYSMDASPIEILRTDDQQIQLVPEQQIVISMPIREHEFPGLLLSKADGIATGHPPQL